jgi:hypothetical protein
MHMRQPAQMALALATSAGPGPFPLIGKKISGSADRHAASSHQLLVPFVATLAPPCAKGATYPGRAFYT